MFKIALRIALFAALVAFVVIDIIWDDMFLEHSSDLSLALQTWGGKPLEIWGLVYTTFFAYVTLPILYFHFVYAKRQLLALYYFFLYGFALMFCLWIKLAFYKGRPYVVNLGLKGSTCDPGMPSGHTVLAISGYYVIHQIVVRELFPGNRGAKLASAVLCSITALSIMLSRITLGDHSYNQVLMGALISANVILNVDFEGFCEYVVRLPKCTKSLLLPIEVINFAYLVAMCFLNHAYRENPSFWKYMSKNPSCQNTFVIGAAMSVPFNSWFIGCFLYYPYRRKVPTEYLMAEIDSNSKKATRFLLHCLVALPVLPLLIGGLLVFNSSLDIFMKSLLISIFGTLAASYLAFAMVNLSKRAFEWCGVAIYEDYLNIFSEEDLDSEKNIVYSEVEMSPPNRQYGDFL